MFYDKVVPVAEHGSYHTISESDCRRVTGTGILSLDGSFPSSLSHSSTSASLEVQVPGF